MFPRVQGLEQVISGNGVAIGIGPTIFSNLLATGDVAHNPHGPETSFDPAGPGVSKREARFYARTGIALATW